MNWIKQGLVIRPQQHRWSKTHCMVPFAEHIEDDVFQVWYSGRDSNNKSHIGSTLLDLSNLGERFGEVWRLLPGELGCFDDCGVTPSWVIEINGERYLYYIGWRQQSSVRMELMIGMAMLDEGIFLRCSRAPLFDRTSAEPYSILTAPCILKTNTYDTMWYVSGSRWVNPDLPEYNIKMAFSKDGFKWERDGKAVLDLENGETALARPCVLVEDNKYKMWFSYKGENYRIGYAESIDGRNWERKDSGIDVSESGFDSDMMCYAFVFNHKGKKYMLYNGNDYGREGIGLCVQQ